MEEEEGVINEVALKKALGLHGEAEEPLEAELLDKGGGLANFAGMEGESGADAEVDGGRKFVEMFGDPEFLLRAAEADPHAVGSGVADEADYFFKLAGGPFAEGWRVGSGDISI